MTQGITVKKMVGRTWRLQDVLLSFDVHITTRRCRRHPHQRGSEMRGTSVVKIDACLDAVTVSCQRDPTRLQDRLTSLIEAKGHVIVIVHRDIHTVILREQGYYHPLVFPFTTDSVSQMSQFLKLARVYFSISFNFVAPGAVTLDSITEPFESTFKSTNYTTLGASSPHPSLRAVLYLSARVQERFGQPGKWASHGNACFLPVSVNYRRPKLKRGPT